MWFRIAATLFVATSCVNGQLIQDEVNQFSAAGGCTNFNGNTAPTLTASLSNGDTTINANHVPPHPWQNVNPNEPKAFTSTYVFKTPTELAPGQEICLNQGPIGIAKNGVFIYNPTTACGGDAKFDEEMDSYHGHPDPKGVYHYHYLPDNNDVWNSADSDVSQFIGVAFDGYPIYSKKDGLDMTQLDVCHGMEVEGRYRYIATADHYPYFMGCYRGQPQVSGAGGSASCAGMQRGQSCTCQFGVASNKKRGLLQLLKDMVKESDQEQKRQNSQTFCGATGAGALRIGGPPNGGGGNGGPPNINCGNQNGNNGNGGGSTNTGGSGTQTGGSSGGSQTGGGGSQNGGGRNPSGGGPGNGNGVSEGNANENGGGPGNSGGAESGPPGRRPPGKGPPGKPRPRPGRPGRPRTKRYNTNEDEGVANGLTKKQQELLENIISRFQAANSARGTANNGQSIVQRFLNKRNQDAEQQAHLTEQQKQHVKLNKRFFEQLGNLYDTFRGSGGQGGGSSPNLGRLSSLLNSGGGGGSPLDGLTGGSNPSYNYGGSNVPIGNNGGGGGGAMDTVLSLLGNDGGGSSGGNLMNTALSLLGNNAGGSTGGYSHSGNTGGGMMDTQSYQGNNAGGYSAGHSGNSGGGLMDTFQSLVGNNGGGSSGGIMNTLGGILGNSGGGGSPLSGIFGNSQSNSGGGLGSMLMSALFKKRALEEQQKKRGLMHKLSKRQTGDTGNIAPLTGDLLGGLSAGGANNPLNGLAQVVPQILQTAGVNMPGQNNGANTNMAGILQQLLQAAGGFIPGSGSTGGSSGNSPVNQASNILTQILNGGNIDLATLLQVFQLVSAVPGVTNYGQPRYDPSQNPLVGVAQGGPDNPVGSALAVLCVSQGNPFLAGLVGGGEGNPLKAALTDTNDPSHALLGALCSMSANGKIPVNQIFQLAGSGGDANPLSPHIGGANSNTFPLAQLLSLIVNGNTANTNTNSNNNDLQAVLQLLQQTGAVPGQVTGNLAAILPLIQAVVGPMQGNNGGTSGNNPLGQAGDLLTGILGSIGQGGQQAGGSNPAGQIGNVLGTLGTLFGGAANTNPNPVPNPVPNQVPNFFGSFFGKRK